jgi:molybdopterin converting factor small subunit
MNIRVEYLSQLRVLAGCRDEEIALSPGTDLEGLLRAIGLQHGQAVSQLILDESGKVSSTVLCFVASKQVDRTHVLCDGDEVMLMTPISGG